MENKEKRKIEEQKQEEETSPTSTEDSKDVSNYSSEKGSETRDSKDRKKSPSSESPFHKQCRPIEPNRDFVAKPIPQNVFSKQSPIKNGDNNLIF